MILDTNAVSALGSKDADLITLLASSARHHLPVVVIGEYDFGLTNSRRGEDLRKWLTWLVSESIVLPIDLETAARYALLRKELKQTGKPIPVNDLWIAALAMQHGLPIVSRDAHFDHVSSVKRIAW